MNKINKALTRGVDKIYPNRQALAKVLRSGKRIRLYQGFDPSMPNLHLGNLVGILKLRHFQELGHEVIFLVGDFTGMIGDPTDKSSARQLLTRKQVLKNAQNWQKQAGKVLDFKGKNRAKIMFNSQWNDKINFKELIGLTAHFTVQQMLERDFFQQRLKHKKPIYLHEFLYPVAQAIDSVKMAVDLEIGGTDQTFNMLAGRTLMKALKGREKFVLTNKLLVDKQNQKVGKTTGNALFLNASSIAMFGNIMSFPDEVIALAFELLTNKPIPTNKVIKKKPMTMKKLLAFEIVKMLYGQNQAKQAKQEFEKVYQKKKLPSISPLLPRPAKNPLKALNLLIETKLLDSKAEAKRLIKQKALKIDGKIINNPQQQVKFVPGKTIIQLGKRKWGKVK